MKPPHSFFKAFADPARLRILFILAQGERCVCDMMAVLKMGQSKVSRHLAYLRRAGLVVGRKEGLWVHYSLNKSESALQSKLLESLQCCRLEAPIFDRDTRFLNEMKRKECSALKIGEK